MPLSQCDCVVADGQLAETQRQLSAFRDEGRDHRVSESWGAEVGRVVADLVKVLAVSFPPQR